MALTLPGDFSHLPAETVIAHFRVLQRRFSQRWAGKGVALDWKRELQNRMALHYHLLLYGLEDPELRESVRTWFIAQWNSLCCATMNEKSREHHRWFHARDENFQEVRDMAGYFAKYVGKAEDAGGALPGRWWGSWNKDALPVSKIGEVPLLPTPLAKIRRIARKLRANRANEAKHRSICSQFGLEGCLSRWALQCLRMGYGINGFRRPHGESSSNNPSGPALAAMFDEAARSRGTRFGKAKFRGGSHSSAPIILLGKTAPESMNRAIRWILQQANGSGPSISTKVSSVSPG